MFPLPFASVSVVAITVRPSALSSAAISAASSLRAWGQRPGAGWVPLADSGQALASLNCTS